jgi:hypothetical protein
MPLDLLGMLITHMLLLLLVPGAVLGMPWWKESMERSVSHAPLVLGTVLTEQNAGYEKGLDIRMEQ